MANNHQKQVFTKIEGGLSIVLPAYNERENIEPMVQEAKAAGERFADSYEIIIVDDGSVDKTAEIAEELAKRDRHIKLVRHSKNLGYGSALADGFKAAKLRWIFFTDSDRQFQISELEKLIPRISESKMVIGFREKRADQIHRRVYTRVFNCLVNFLFGLKVKDVNAAFKLFAREIIEGRNFISPGALINAELLFIARVKGIDPVQVPVSHFPRKAGRQTGGSLKVLARASRELVRLYSQRGIIRREVKLC